MLGLLAGTALIKVYSGNGVAESHRISLSWFNPFNISSPGVFAAGILAAVFIYWGWDTAVACNEETADATKTPGRAAVISTILLLLTYVIATLGAQALGRRRHHRHRPRQPEQLRRRAERPGHQHLRHRHRRDQPHQAAAVHGHDQLDGVDADDDPAHRANDAVDGGVQGGSQHLRQDPPQVPDPDLVDLGHGRRVGRVLRDPDHGQRQRAERLDRLAGADDRLLLRADRLRLLLVLPQRRADGAPGVLAPGRAAPGRDPAAGAVRVRGQPVHRPRLRIHLDHAARPPATRSAGCSRWASACCCWASC